MPAMRAKMIITSIEKFTSGHEKVNFAAVAKTGGYPEDGSDEDNSYARWSPSANLSITIANPALWGKFEAGQKFYVDFTRADAPAEALTQRYERGQYAPEGTPS